MNSIPLKSHPNCKRLGGYKHNIIKHVYGGLYKKIIPDLQIKAAKKWPLTCNEHTFSTEKNRKIKSKTETKKDCKKI